MPPIPLMFIAGGAGDVVGQQAYTTAGSYSFVVPAGVTSVCTVCVGAGGGGRSSGTTLYDGAGGGGLRWVNALSVTPGETLTIDVGGSSAFTNGGTSSIKRGATTLIAAYGGTTDGVGGQGVVNAGGTAAKVKG